MKRYCRLQNALSLMGKKDAKLCAKYEETSLHILRSCDTMEQEDSVAYSTLVLKLGYISLGQEEQEVRAFLTNWFKGAGLGLCLRWHRGPSNHLRLWVDIKFLYHDIY